MRDENQNSTGKEFESNQNQNHQILDGFRDDEADINSLDPEMLTDDAEIKAAIERFESINDSNDFQETYQRAINSLPISDEFYRQTAAKMQQALEQQPKKKIIPIRRVSTIAASIVLTLGIGAAGYFNLFAADRDITNRPALVTQQDTGKTDQLPDSQGGQENQDPDQDAGTGQTPGTADPNTSAQNPGGTNGTDSAQPNQPANGDAPKNPTADGQGDQPASGSSEGNQDGGSSQNGNEGENSDNSGNSAVSHPNGNDKTTSKATAPKSNTATVPSKDTPDTPQNGATAPSDGKSGSTTEDKNTPPAEPQKPKPFTGPAGVSKENAALGFTEVTGVSRARSAIDPDANVIYQKNLITVNEELQAYLGAEQYQAWYQQFCKEVNGKSELQYQYYRRYMSDLTANYGMLDSSLWGAIRHFNIPKEEFIKAYQATEKRPFGYYWDSAPNPELYQKYNCYLTDEQVDALYSGSQSEVLRTFVGEDAVYYKGNLYPYLWFENHTAEEYHAAGFTVKKMESILSALSAKKSKYNIAYVTEQIECLKNIK